jgi:hypothetical protein
MSFFTAIYEINNWDINKWLETVLLYKRLSDKLLEWDSTLVWMIVWITIQDISINNISYLLDNYTFEKQDLELLKKEFSYSLNSKEIFTNAIKMEYQTNKYWFEKGILKWEIRSSLIFDLDEYLIDQRNAWNSVINMENYYDLHHVNYFKRNYIYRFLSWVRTFSNNWYYEDLENLNNERKKLLEKIELKFWE